MSRIRVKLIRFLPVAALAVVCCGCAPANYTYPLRPLEDGQTYTSVHATVPFSDFARLSLQLSVTHAVDEDLAMGCTFTNLIIPTSFDLFNRISRGETDRYILASLNVSKYNPLIEVAFAETRSDGEASYAWKLGAGLDAALIPGGSLHATLIPVAEGVIRYGDARLAAGTRIGSTKSTLMHVERQRDDVYIEYSADEIDSVIVDSTTVREGYGIVLKNGRMLNVRMRDPYADCIVCGMRTRAGNAYSVSPGHRTWNIFYSSSENLHLATGELWMMQLNMKEILARFESEGRLVIEEDPDILERTLESNNMWIEDLYIDLGYVDYNSPD